MNKIRQSGFTLIEVLIVVVIMSVLAATIIPQFSATTDDAKESAQLFNMHTLRSQIELYRIHHTAYPDLDVAENLGQLTSATNAAGTIGTGDGFPFGPYITAEIPENPFNSDNTVVAGTGDDVVAGGAGWQYDKSTGGIWPNNTEYFASESP